MRLPSSRAAALKLAGLALAVVLLLVVGAILLGVVPSGDQPPAEPESVDDGAGPGALQPPAPAASAADIPEGGTGRNFELVGHAPLLDDHQYVGDESFGIPRGSNGDVTVAGDCVYVGSLVGHQPPLIVDVADPSDPEVVGPVPDAVPGTGNGIEGMEASGDLLVIDQRTPPSQLWFEPPNDLPDRGLSVWDISEDCRQPELVARHDFGNLSVHDVRLWRDPQNPDRVLAVQTFLGSPNLKVLDLTGCQDGSCDPALVAEWDLNRQTGYTGNSHEAILSTDGRRVYLAQPDLGFLMLDSTNLLSSVRGEGECDPAAPTDVPAADSCLTVLDPEVGESLKAQPGHPNGIPHSLLRIPDRPYFLASGESSGPVYHQSNETVQLGACPGSAVRIVGLEEGGNATDETASVGRTLVPDPLASYVLPGQESANCNSDHYAPGTVASPGWLSPHFSLAFPDVAFTTYYSGGLRAIDLSDPANPREAGYFFNDPVSKVRWASYGMSGEPEVGGDGTPIHQPLPTQPHAFAFSDPVLHDGHVIYGDVHSGLYVLEYTGPHADQLPDEGTCLPANPGAVEPGYEPCPPYGQTNWTAGR